MKKLFIINSDIYIRHYLRTDALQSIEDDNFYYLATDDVTDAAELEAKPNFLGYFHYDPEVFEQHLFCSHVLMLRYQDRSITFGWRARRQLDHFTRPLSEEFLQETSTYQGIYKSLKWLPDGLARGAAFQMTRAIKFLKMPAYNRHYLNIFIMGRPVLAEIFRAIFARVIKPNKQLAEILAREKPDLVIFPSHAIDPLGNDLVRLQRKLNFKTLYLIDNWDNLSSKSVFLYNPDYLGVWGEQSRHHAETIHDIPPERVFLLGTPRVDDYYETLDRILSGKGKPESPYPFRYLLYVGCSIPFDEMTSLRLIDPVLGEINRTSDEPIKLVYRPHPWRNKRQCPDMFDPAEFKHIVLDEQLADYYYHGKQYNRFEKGLYQPSLEYYPRLLANAEMVTGPLTTMLVESALLRKKVLAVAYDDGIHVTSPHNALKYYRHFEGLTDVPGIWFTHTKEDFGPLVKKVFDTPENSIDWEEQERRIGYYLFNDKCKYHERLKDAVDAISGRVPAKVGMGLPEREKEEVLL